jgi:hypothetical protein
MITANRHNEVEFIFHIEPILHQILPIKKATRPPNWTKREILNGIFYQLKNGCNWQDLPKDLPPYSTVYWYYKQWRSQGVLEELMRVLHSQVREQAKKPNWQGCFILNFDILCIYENPPFHASGIFVFDG